MKNQFKKLTQWSRELYPAILLFYALIGGIPVVYFQCMAYTYHIKMYVTGMNISTVIYAVLAVLIVKWLR